MTPYSRIVLVGFSGSGKTTVGELLAGRLGWDLVDLDEAIEAAYGADIPAVFATRAREDFRRTERRLLAGALDRTDVVIATGGGAVAADDAWGDDLLGRPRVLVVALDAAPETTFARLTEQQATEGERTARPMLAGDDPLARMHALKARRQASYDRAHVTLSTDRVPPELVAGEIATLANRPPGVDVHLTLPNAESWVAIQAGIAREASSRIRRVFPKASRLWVVADENVAALHGDMFRAALCDGGFDVRMTTVAPGEGSKSLQGAGVLYDWLLGEGVERRDVVVALGGGVVGDLAGFVAATTLRGIGLVQVPTSLLAMVDSSVGGKTGINHAAGKNLIGAFSQPPLVLIDPDLLGTLPARELTSGWAEIVKHAVIQASTPGGERADLWGFLERNADRLLALGQPALAYLIHRNVALKAAVVEADEREADLRQILNFGHTLGHAIEAAEYRYLHGEAVAVGMQAAARLGVAMGTCGEALVERLDRTLDRYSLPAVAEADPERVLALTKSDKKRGSGRQRWVLPLDGSGVAIREDVPEEAVREALAAVTR